MAITYKSWLGRVVGKAFRETWKRFWNKDTRDNDGGIIGSATRKFIVFPFEGLEPVFIDIYNRFYWLTADLINQMGCNIGDSAMGKIDDSLKQAKDYAMAKVEETRKQIQDNLIAPIKRTIENDLKPRLKELGINIDTMETDVRNAMSEVGNMKNTLSRFNNDIENFKSKIGAFDSKLGDLSTRANNLDAQLKTLQQNVASNLEGIRALQARVAKLEGKAPFELPSIFKQ